MPKLKLVNDLTSGTFHAVYEDKHRDLIEKFCPVDSETTRRVSSVELDDNGEWVSRLEDGTEIARGKNREQVVREEHEIIAGMLARGESPAKIKIP